MINARRLWHTLSHVKSFGGQVLLTVGTNGLLVLLGVVTGVFLARLLGPEGRGELAAIQMWPASFMGLSLLGVHEALAYYAAIKPHQSGQYVASAVTLGLLSSVLFLGVGSLVLPLFLAAQSVEVISAARWYLLQLPLVALIWVPQHALRGRGDFAAWNGLRLAPSLGWLAVICLAWAFGRAEPWTLAMGYLVALAITGFPVLFIINRRIQGPFRPDPQQWPSILRYGLFSVGGNVPLVLNVRLDQMLMASLLPVHMLGLYVVAVTWSGAVSPLLSALGAVLFSRLAVQLDIRQQTEAFAQGSRIAVFLAGGVTTIVLLCTPWAVTLFFGEQFADAIPPALVLVMAAAVAGVNLVLEDGLRGLGNPQAVLLAECGGLVITVISLLLLLPALGIMGAALSSVLGYIAVSILLVIQVWRLTGSSPIAFLCPTRQDVSLSWRQGRALMAEFMPR